MSAAQRLQTAIFARLTGDAALSALIGPDGVHDGLIARATAPYLRFVEIDSRDWSTASDRGEEHLIRLEARTGEGGGRTAEVIAARVKALLHDAALDLSGSALVSLLHQRTKIGRDDKARCHVAQMLFRAVTE